MTGFNASVPMFPSLAGPGFVSQVVTQTNGRSLSYVGSMVTGVTGPSTYQAAVFQGTPVAAANISLATQAAASVRASLVTRDCVF